MKDIEKSKNPMTQLKNATNKLQKVSEVQDHQRSQIMLENDRCMKVSQKQLHSRNEFIHSTNTNNKLIVAMTLSAKKIDSV